MPKDRVICYANLHAFNSAADVTDEQMRMLFDRIPNKEEYEIVDIVIDRYDETVHPTKRDGWKRIEEACENGEVDLIVTPSISMISFSLTDVHSIIEDIKDKHNVGFYSVIEQVSTLKEDYKAVLQMQLMLFDMRERQKKAEKEMREMFLDVTGHSGEPRAISVYVDNEQYEKAEKMARFYGMSVRELMAALLVFATVPQNKVSFEEHILGVEPPKPMRGRPSKSRK